MWWGALPGSGNRDGERNHLLAGSLWNRLVRQKSAKIHMTEPVGWDPAVEDPEQQAGLGLGPRHGGQLHQVNIPAVTVGFCNTNIGFLHVVVCL